eukprot:Tbor_TRINITY_DN5334_c0_g1::TRINITY_DN5334_c0_g1_i1::g.4586::m.4586
MEGFNKRMTNLLSGPNLLPHWKKGGSHSKRFSSDRRSIIHNMGFTDPVDIGTIETELHFKLNEVVERNKKLTKINNEQDENKEDREKRERADEKLYPHIRKIITKRLEIEEFQRNINNNPAEEKRKYKKELDNMIKSKSIDPYNALLLHYLLADDEKVLFTSKGTSSSQQKERKGTYTFP